MKKLFACILVVSLFLSAFPCFAFAEEKVILSEAYATVTVPKAGEHPDFSPVSGEGDKYSIITKTWYQYSDNYPDLNENSTFEAGGLYALRVEFVPEEGYDFDYNTVFKINGTVSGCYGSAGFREILFKIPQEVFDVKTEKELNTALNQSSHVKEINITESFTVNSDCMVYYNGDKLNNYHDTVLTIKEGVTLTLGNGGVIGAFWPSYGGDWETPPLPDCKIINNGTVIIENGGATAADFHANNGNIIVKDGGSAVVVNENYGTVTVENGGSYVTTQGGDAHNHGTVIINEGAYMEARFGTSIINDEDGKIILNGRFRCNSVSIDGNSDFWFRNNGAVEGHGDVIIAAADSQVLPVNDKDSLIEKMMEQLGQEKRFDNWDDVNIYKLEEAYNSEEFESYLSAQRTVAGEAVEGNMDTIVELNDSIVIRDGKKLRAMVQVIVKNGVKLNISGGACLECSIENSGMITVHEGSTLSTTMGGRIANYGNLNINENAILKSQMGSPVENMNGASLKINGEFFCGCVNYDDNDHYWFSNSGNLSGSGFITLYEADHSIMPVSDMDALVSTVQSAIAGAGDPLPTVRKFIRTPGDINGDSAVNNKDLMRLFQHLSGWDVEADLSALDVNGDDSVNNKDITRLFKYLSGWDVEIF